MQTYFDQINENETEITGCLELVKIFDELEIQGTNDFKQELDEI